MKYQITNTITNQEDPNADCVSWNCICGNYYFAGV